MAQGCCRAGAWPVRRGRWAWPCTAATDAQQGRGNGVRHADRRCRTLRAPLRRTDACAAAHCARGDRLPRRFCQGDRRAVGLPPRRRGRRRAQCAACRGVRAAQPSRGYGRSGGGAGARGGGCYRTLGRDRALGRRGATRARATACARVRDADGARTARLFHLRCRWRRADGRGDVSGGVRDDRCQVWRQLAACGGRQRDAPGDGRAARDVGARDSAALNRALCARSDARTPQASRSSLTLETRLPPLTGRCGLCALRSRACAERR